MYFNNFRLIEYKLFKWILLHFLPTTYNLLPRSFANQVRVCPYPHNITLTSLGDGVGSALIYQDASLHSGKLEGNIVSVRVETYNMHHTHHLNISEYCVEPFITVLS
jgi:hypothetical protein